MHGEVASEARACRGESNDSRKNLVEVQHLVYLHCWIIQLNHKIMEASLESTLENTYKEVRSFSYAEKKISFVPEEEPINEFLDAVNNFKSDIVSRTERINSIVLSLEKLTWGGEADDEVLMLINDLISSCKDLKSSLIRSYVSTTFLRKKGIAKKEIKAFKASIDDLQEAFDDLESIYFHLPKIEGFTETTNQLSLV